MRLYENTRLGRDFFHGSVDAPFYFEYLCIKWGIPAIFVAVVVAAAVEQQHSAAEDSAEDSATEQGMGDDESHAISKR